VPVESIQDISPSLEPGRHQRVSWQRIVAQAHGHGTASRNGTASGGRLAEDPGASVVRTSELRYKSRGDDEI
jgi:hypothetical protein